MHCFHSWLSLASLTGADALCSTHVHAKKNALVALASSASQNMVPKDQRLDKAQQTVSGHLVTATSMLSTVQTPLFSTARGPMGESRSSDTKSISSTFETEISTPRPRLYRPVLKSPYLERMQKLRDRTLEMKVVWVVAPLGPVVWAAFCLISKSQECSVEASKRSQLSATATNSPLAEHVPAPIFRSAPSPSPAEFTSTEACY